MARIKIKTREKNRRQRDKLLEILASHDIFATNIIEARDGYVVTVLKSQEQDAVFTQECQTALAASDFSSVTPPDLK